MIFNSVAKQRVSTMQALPAKNHWHMQNSDLSCLNLLLRVIVIVLQVMLFLILV